MNRVYAAIVALWFAVAWIPFPAGFVLVRVLDPRQGDRMAFATGVGIAAIAALPTLLIWLVVLLVAASRIRRLPGLGATLGLLLAAGLFGVFVSAAVGAAMGPFGALVLFPALGALVLLLVATALAYLIVRLAFGLPQPEAPAA